MTLLTDQDDHAQRALRSSPTVSRLPEFERPSGPVLVPTTGRVVALRRRRAVALGGLDERRDVTSDNLVIATDLVGQRWWIPAGAVWTDADESALPRRPAPIGLAMGGTEQRAVLSGLSDRLGWEAVAQLEAGRQLPIVDDGLLLGDSALTAFDGRLTHGVPTVVLVGEDTVRWGAGSSWDAAVRRATYGDEPTLAATNERSMPDELTMIAGQLADQGLQVASVDVGTSLLRTAGIVRCSVQLLAA